MLDESSLVVNLQDLLFRENRSLDILEFESSSDLKLLTEQVDGSIGFHQTDEGNLAHRNCQLFLMQQTVGGQLAQLFSPTVSGDCAMTQVNVNV